MTGKNTGASPGELIICMRNGYVRFIQEETDRLARSGYGKKIVRKLVFGSSAGDEALIGFYKQLEELCGEVCAALKDVDQPERSDLAFQAAELIMFHELEGQEQLPELTLLACEHLAMDFLPLVNEAGLKELRSRYVTRTKKRDMLPKQLKLLKAMDALLKTAK